MQCFECLMLTRMGDIGVGSKPCESPRDAKADTGAKGHCLSTLGVRLGCCCRYFNILNSAQFSPFAHLFICRYSLPLLFSIKVPFIICQCYSHSYTNQGHSSSGVLQALCQWNSAYCTFIEWQTSMSPHGPLAARSVCALKNNPVSTHTAPAL